MAPPPGMPPVPPGMSSMPPIPGVSRPADVGASDPMGQLAEKMGGVRADAAVSVAEELTGVVQKLMDLKSKDPRLEPLINAMLQPVLQGMPPQAGGGVQGPVSQGMPGPGGPPMPGLGM